MYYNSKQERVTSDRKLVAGTEKKLGKSTSIVLNGRKMKMSELVAMIEARIEAADVVETARVAWQVEVDKEQQAVDAAQPFIDALRAYLVATLGKAPDALKDFGITVHPRRVLTSDQLAAKAKKARDTRKARRVPATSPAPAAKVAAVLLGDTREAEDFAQDVLLIAMYGGPKGGGKWSGEGDPWLHLRGLLKSAVWTRRRAIKRGTREQDVVAKTPREDDDYNPNDAPPPSSQPAAWNTPLRLIEKGAEDDAEEQRRARLDAGAAADPLAVRVLALFDEGISGEEEQAAALKVDKKEIKRVRKSLQRMARKEQRS